VSRVYQVNSWGKYSNDRVPSNYNSRRNNANDARKPAPGNKTDYTLQDDVARLPNDGDDSKRSTNMHAGSEPAPKRAKKQDPPGLRYTSQNAASDSDRKPTGIDTDSKPQCDEVHTIEPRVMSTFAGLDTGSDAGNTEAPVVGSHIRQKCSIHNFVSVNNGVTTQEWQGDNKEYWRHGITCTKS
jgi:hypothetical protein